MYIMNSFSSILKIKQVKQKTIFLRTLLLKPTPYDNCENKPLRFIYKPETWYLEPFLYFWPVCLNF